MPYTEFHLGGPTLDGWSLGHMVFGLVSAAMYMMIIKILAACLPFGGITWLMFSLMISPMIFIGWEVIEHQFMKRHVYKAILKEYNWRENSNNSIMDVVIGIGFFYALFLIYVVCFYDDTVFIIFAVVFTHAAIPIAIYSARQIEKLHVKRRIY